MTSTPPLWRRLQRLQPTLPLLADRHHSAVKNTREQATAAPRHMSYSFVVVPPPVPAAMSAFEAHVSTLLRYVPHPAFITCTSYSPYFTSIEAERVAAAPCTAAESGNPAKASATQQALSYLHQRLAADVGLVLTVTATRATHNPTSVQSTEGGNQDSQQRPTQHASSSTCVEPTTTLTGARRGGTAAVLADFIKRTCTAPVTELDPANSQEATRHRSRGLMVLRGDDGGYTRQRMRAAQKGGASVSLPNPYIDFAGGLPFLRFIYSTLTSRGREATYDVAGDASAGAAMCLCVGGYPQGHVLDRQWGATQEGADVASLRFLEEVDTVFAKTEAQLRRARGAHGNPRPPSLQSCMEVADALFARLSAVRRLWATPSYYPPSVRAACTRRTISDKMFLRPPETQQCVAEGAWDFCGSAGARVVVTQMITSATEFFDYIEEIRCALRSSREASGSCLQLRASPALPSSSPSLVVVPGLMAPLQGEQFLRSTLQLKVIPSVPIRSALQEYEGALHAAVERLRSATASSPDTARSSSDTPVEASEGKWGVSVCSNAIDVYQEAKEKAEVCFQERMEAITVGIVRNLRARGYTHVNFSTFHYGCGEAVGRVVAALAAEGKEAVQES